MKKILSISVLIISSFIFFAFNDISSSPNFEDGVIDIGVVTWGGFAGGQYFNEGFEVSEESRFFTEYGLKVRFHLLDDFDTSREAFLNNKVDLLWSNTETFGNEIPYFENEGIKPKIVFLTDFSRGGDVIVANKGWEKLKNPKIAVSSLTPSHSLFLHYNALNPINGYNKKKRKAKKGKKKWEIIEVPSSIDAAGAYYTGNVDAAVVWAPDDKYCKEKISGTKIIASTADEPYHTTISGVLIADEEYIENNHKKLISLFEGWVIGVHEINKNEKSKLKAAHILSKGMGQPKDFCYDLISNAKLCDISDNKSYFGLDEKVDGKVIGRFNFEKGNEDFINLGYMKERKFEWESYSDYSIVNKIPD